MKQVTKKVIDPFQELTEAEKRESELLAQIAMTIVEKRTSMGMTQTEFANYLGVSQAMVYKWESCSYNFTLKSLTKLYASLNLKLEITAITA